MRTSDSIYASIKQTIIGSVNGVSPGRRQAVIWTNAGILLIGPLGTNVSEILIEINIFLFNEMHLKMSSGKWRPFWLGLNVLNWSKSVINDVTIGWLEHKSGHWFSLWHGANQLPSQQLNQNYLLHWRIYASASLMVLTFTPSTQGYC